MSDIRRIALFVLLSCSFAFANQAYTGYCSDGGKRASTSGLNSANTIMASYPGCTVTVNNLGGGLATIFSDNIGTPLSNPFTASSITGQFTFYAANARYSIILSGGFPIPFPSPVTITDVLLNDPAGTSITQATVTANSFMSSSVNPSLTGIFRASSSDSAFCFRNFANTNDICIKKTGAASANQPANMVDLTGFGAVEAASFETATVAPAVGGVLACAASDSCVNIRNQTNTADVVAISKDSSDRVVVGGSAGLSTAAINDTGAATIAGGLTATTGSFSGSISGTGATFTSEVAPSITGVQLGDTAHRWDLFARNIDWTGTFTGGVMAATSLSLTGSLSVTGGSALAIVGQRVYADQKCTTPGVFDVTCWQNAMAALPASGGTIVLGSHTYNFGASTLTIGSANSHIIFSGDAQGDVTTGGTRIIGTASPLFLVQGTSAAVRAVKVAFRDMTISPSAYNAAQICFEADHVTDIDFRQVTFSSCGQAEWLNDYFRVIHNRVSYSTGVGSGNTNTTAVVRLENTSNPGTASEEAWWDYSIWEGDATLTGKQGTAVYVGPATSQTLIADSKMDYGSTASANTIIQLFKTLDFKLHDTQVANTTGTGSGLITILVDGAGGALSTDIHIHDNTISMPNATGVGVRVNFGSSTTIHSNFLSSNAGTAKAVDITANAVNTHAFDNFNLNGDTAITDASSSSKYLLPLSPGTNVLRSSPFNRMTLFGDLLVNGNSAGNIAAFLNGADATGNVNVACGLTTGQDCQINFQDQTQTTKGDILMASIAHGGRMSIQAGGNTGAQVDQLGNFYVNNLVLGGTPTGTGIPTVTLKKGSGAGNYTSASTTYVVVDATNLCYTVTIPTGWKLSITVTGSLGTSTAAVGVNLALTDNAACATANAGILLENSIQTVGAGTTGPVALNWVINGDGAVHNIALQFKTSNGADAALLGNSSATFLPVMTFLLTPSN